MNRFELKAILDNHLLYQSSGGNEGIRAYLSGADLSGADLSGANLREANLSGANLTEANLSGANLREANLSGANLSFANMTEANLSGANLNKAIFNFAKLDDCRGIKALLLDPRKEKGYILIEWLCSGKPWFNSGCRSFSKWLALAHWGSDNYVNKERGQMYCEAIKEGGAKQ